MPDTILTLPEAELTYWKNVYEQRYLEVRKKLEPLQKEYDQMRPVLIQLGIIKDVVPKSDSRHSINSGPNEVQSDGYDISWKWLDKIVFVVEKVGRPLTSGEIIDEILRREPRESKIRLINSIPATLSAAYKTIENSNIKRKARANGEFEYWIDNLPF